MAKPANKKAAGKEYLEAKAEVSQGPVCVLFSCDQIQRQRGTYVPSSWCGRCAYVAMSPNTTKSLSCRVSAFSFSFNFYRLNVYFWCGFVKFSSRSYMVESRKNKTQGYLAENPNQPPPAIIAIIIIVKFSGKC